MTNDVRREQVPEDELVGPKAVYANEKTGKKLAKSGDYRGEFEQNAMERGEPRFAPLSVSPEASREVTYYQAFSTQYEIYKIPTYHAARSLGRVKDLVDAGAPRGPAEIDAKTAKRFRKIDPTSEGAKGREDGQTLAVGNQWSEQQEEQQASFEEYMGSRESLQAALLEFRAGQRILHRRGLEAERAGKEGEKAKIDQAAETLVKITQIATAATGYMGALEAAMASEEEYEETTVDDPDTMKSVDTHKVKKTSTAKKAFGIAKQAGGMLDLKGIFIWAMGDSAEYERLQREIAKLSSQIEDDKIMTEDFQIASANEKLKNVKVSISGRQRAFSAKRALTRDAARNFGQALGGGEKSIMVALMAEAYQELELFGMRSLEEVNQLMPAARGVYGWLDDHAERYKLERRDDFSVYASDYQSIGNAVVDVYNSRDMLKREVPVWRQTSIAWKHFLTDILGTSFDKNDLGDSKAPVGTREGS